MADRDLARTEVHPTDTRAGAHPMDFTEEQRQLIRDTFANGASDAEFESVDKMRPPVVIRPGKTHAFKQISPDLGA